METKSVHVGLAGREYDIVIGPDLISQAGVKIGPLLKRKKVFIVSEETVAGLHLSALQAGLASASVEEEHLILHPGESTKNWENLQRVVEWLIAQKAEREDLLVAFGGGVIGDLAGFAAAIVRRGIGFVQIPTTLLAQVDSSVGGKTGINSVNGKNLVGAFHQPRFVLADVDLLGTLSRRDFLAGYGEVAKYGMLGDAGFFEWLETNGSLIARGNIAARIEAVRWCCQMKADIVVRDETERGDRALLNLGHTFGHALEAATGYSDRLLHGEGVSVGCALAFELSQRLGLCSQEAPSRVRAHLDQMGMKKDLRDIAGDLPDADALIELMGQDKKVRNGQIAFILVRDIGESFVSRDVPMEVVRDLLAEALQNRN